MIFDDEFAGMSGIYIIDPKTGKRMPQEEAPKEQVEDDPAPTDKSTAEE